MTSPGYKDIDYRLRPAKAIQRKMLCEALNRLIVFSDLTEYRYVGFGATFFMDFFLVHKALGINELISIEKNTNHKRRFQFNCPYKCVQLEFGKSNDVLPKIKWKKKTILWADYNDPLSDEMLTDTGTFVSRAAPGSVILITINVHPDNLPDKKGEKSRYDQLLERISKVKIPIDVKEKDLDKENYPRVCHSIVNNEIQEVLSQRNGGLENKNKLVYKQLFNFYYDDSAPMLSFGGVIYEESSFPIEKCNFEKLDFLRCKQDKFDPYRIEVPVLTHREMRDLDKILPYENLSSIRADEIYKCLGSKMIEDYRKIYRYIPNFVEAQVH